MTEYDYSPEAYDKYLATQARISNWVATTNARSHEYRNPFQPEDQYKARTTAETRGGGGGGGESRPRPGRTRSRTLDAVPTVTPSQSLSQAGTSSRHRPSASTASASTSRPRPPPARSNTTPSFAHHAAVQAQQYAKAAPQHQPQPVYAPQPVVYAQPQPFVYAPQPAPVHVVYRSGSKPPRSHQKSPTYDARDSRTRVYTGGGGAGYGSVTHVQVPPGATYVVRDPPRRATVDTSRTARSSPVSPAGSPSGATSPTKQPLIKRLLTSHLTWDKKDKGRKLSRRGSM